MKKLYSSLLLAFGICASVMAQPCTTSNGAGCGCPDGVSTNCTLLPDLTISWYSIENGSTEYSQTGNGVEDGRLRVTGTTPNIGFGPFTVRGTDYFICGTDTIYDPSRTITTCPSGGTPTNLLQQRVYTKNGSSITYTDRWAGGQTYHPGHGHNHVDDWVTFTLRTEDPNDPDPRHWPIIGTGAKIGFCLMDLTNCPSSSQDCRTDQSVYGAGALLNQASQFRNYGMGGGTYSCSPIEQGISVGYADIYSQSLDGMFITIPPGTCNGDYWIVAEVDPLNNFLESDETNNWTAVPYTLTKQVPAGSALATIDVSGATELCNASSVVLTASPATSYLWSTGETTQSITVADSGHYTVSIASQCGNDVSDPVVITRNSSAILSTISDTTCLNTAATITAVGNGSINWYDSATGGSQVGIGSTITIPSLSGTTTYYADNTVGTVATPQHIGPADHEGTDYSGGTGYNGTVIFDALADFTLKSVKVYTDYAGERTIELRNYNSGMVIEDTTLNIDTGTTIINLDFDVTASTGYELGTSEAQNQSTFGTVTPFLKRSDSGVTYPYTYSGLAELTGNDIGASFYYYFYDWVVQKADVSCTSARTPVVAVAIQAPSLSVNGLDTMYLDTHSAVTITGQPAGGTFSGIGITDNGINASFDPATAGIGQHTVTYSYTDAYGCSNSTTQTVKVQGLPIGINELPKTELRVFPNPTQNILNLEFHSVADLAVTVQVINMIGSTVASQQIGLHSGASTHMLDISKLPVGMYWIEAVTANGTLARTKVVKQ
jgi:hypothetical protein